MSFVCTAVYLQKLLLEWSRGGQSLHLALEADLQDGDYINISAADTAMEPPSRDLMTEVFHDVLVDSGVPGTDTLMSIEKAARLLGHTPDFT